MSREVKRYAVMEYHRKKWLPILSKEEGKPRVISISVENAEIMNLDAEAAIKEKGRTSLFGYFLADEKPEDSKPKLADLRVKYPDIKATSVDTFLQKIEELKNNNDET